MLILSQELDDCTHLVLPDGRKVTIMVVKLEKGRVKLGYDAPKDVQIYRANARVKTPRKR